MKRIYCRYGAFVYCDAMSVDNIYSIDIDEKDKCIELNAVDHFPIAWITGYDRVEEVSFIRYDEKGDLDSEDDNILVENGIMIYKKDDIIDLSNRSW